MACSAGEAPQSEPDSQIAPTGGEDHDSGNSVPNADEEHPDEPGSEIEPDEAVEGEGSVGGAWIGDPCTDDTSCTFDGGYCLTNDQGYPQGVCSKDCSLYCPDQDAKPMTFCIEPVGEDEGSCFSRCDTDYYPENNGCRTGYVCLHWSRHNDASTVHPTCVPQSWQPQQPCLDPTNLAGDDSCYFTLISYGYAHVAELARTILEGNAGEQEARAFLDANYTHSQSFIEEVLGSTIYPNFTSGHSSSQPMRGMIVHYTASQREEGTIRYFVGSSPHASSHFVVGSYRNGLIVQLFSHENRTWHAGSTYNVDRFGFDFANAGYLEQNSTGVWEDYAERDYELTLPLFGNDPVEVTDGIPGEASKYANKDYWQPYTYYQLLSFVLVGRALHLVYGLDEEAIERHGDVSSSRVDPGPAMPLTFSKALIFNSENVLTLDWLLDFKVNPDWIVENPQAR